MSLYERYELLELTRDGVIKTFAAREKGSVRQVSVHLLPGGEAAADVVAGLSRLTGQAQAEILEQGENEGAIYVVTSPWLRSAAFGEWVLNANAPNIQSDPFAKAGTWRIPTAEFGRKTASPPGPPDLAETRVYDAEQVTRVLDVRNATPPVPDPSPKPPADPVPEPPPTPPHTPISSPLLNVNGRGNLNETVDLPAVVRPQPPAPPVRRTSYLLLIIGLGAGVALLLILIFALRK